MTQRRALVVGDGFKSPEKVPADRHTDTGHVEVVDLLSDGARDGVRVWGVGHWSHPASNRVSGSSSMRDAMRTTATKGQRRADEEPYGEDQGASEDAHAAFSLLVRCHAPHMGQR
jgi:hypothetical protein